MGFMVFRVSGLHLTEQAPEAAPGDFQGENTICPKKPRLDPSSDIRSHQASGVPRGVKGLGFRV